MYKIAKENLTALFQKIAAEQELYLPVKTAGQVNFGVWTQDAEVDLDTLKSVKSPKDVFFPQSETLYTCIKEGKKIKIDLCVLCPHTEVCLSRGLHRQI